MPLPKSKPTDQWAALLETELRAESVFTENHRTVEQLQELRRLAGLPYGRNTTYHWIAKLVADNKIRLDRGVDGKRKNVGKYIFI